MDLVEMARLGERGMVVLNPDRHKLLEPTLEEGMSSIWEQTVSVISNNPSGYTLQEYRMMTEDYED